MLSSFGIRVRDLGHVCINQLGVLYYKVLRGSINDFCILYLSVLLFAYDVQTKHGQLEVNFKFVQ